MAKKYTKVYIVDVTGTIKRTYSVLADSEDEAKFTAANMLSARANVTPIMPTYINTEITSVEEYTEDA